jgi:hypothetical protein
MSINARLLDFIIIIIISLYPHTLVCKTGRTLKTKLSAVFFGVFGTFLRGWICGRFPTTDWILVDSCVAFLVMLVIRGRAMASQPLATKFCCSRVCNGRKLLSCVLLLLVALCSADQIASKGAGRTSNDEMYRQK